MIQFILQPEHPAPQDPKLQPPASLAAVSCRNCRERNLPHRSHPGSRSFLVTLLGMSLILQTGSPKRPILYQNQPAHQVKVDGAAGGEVLALAPVLAPAALVLVLVAVAKI